MTGRNRPRVGIGVPVFNGERYLARALDSLLEQTWSDFVIVIGDNASTDRTAEIAQAYVARDRRVTYLRHQENLGAARNFNILFNQAGTEYFRWQAADDLVLPAYTARCLAVLDADSDVVLAYCGTIDIDPEGREIGPYEDRMQVTDPSPHRRFGAVRRNLVRCNAIFGLMRSEVVRGTGLLQPYPHSDRVFLAELALHGKIMEVPERLFRRRYHGAASSAMTDAQREAFFTGRGGGAERAQHWRLLAGYYRAVARAPLRLGERLGLYTDLLKTFVWWRRALGQEAWGAVRHRLRPPRAGGEAGESRVR